MMASSSAKTTSFTVVHNADITCGRTAWLLSPGTTFRFQSPLTKSTAQWPYRWRNGWS